MDGRLHAPQLRLIHPDDPDLDEGPAPSPRMTLPRFYLAWFEPVVLIGERDASDSTRKLWRDTIGWWERLTTNPPLSDCDGNDQLFAKYCELLRSATYQRSKIPGAKNYPLSQYTIRRHIQNVQWLLARASEQGVIARAPRLRQRRIKPKTKPTFGQDQFTAIFEVLSQMQRPAGLPVSTPDFWRGLLATALIAGVRKGTFFRLEWSWFIQRPDGWWIDFPDHSVPKTDRGLCVAVPDWLQRFLFRWPRTGAQVFHNSAGRHGVPYSLTHWDVCHDELQLLAGISKPLPFQAWRRALGQEMIRLGLQFARRVAQRALDHQAIATTDDFYTAAANNFRRTYPPLFHVPDDDRQRRLFS
jgi:integrase